MLRGLMNTKQFSVNNYNSVTLSAASLETCSRFVSDLLLYENVVILMLIIEMLCFYS